MADSNPKQQARLLAALVLRPSEAWLWHSVLFVLNIGVPVLFALAQNNARAGVVGAVAGLLFSLADNDKPLGQRLGLLARTTLVLLAFGTLGHWLGGYNALFWAAFAALTVATASLSVRGSLHAATLRLGALALIAMAGMPQAGASTVTMLLIVASVAALTRTVGAWLFPNAPAISAVAARDFQAEDGTELRFCLAYAGSAAIALALGSVAGLAHPMWAATTVLLVMQPEAKSSYDRIVQRFFGTFVGVLAAAIIISLLHTTQVLVACVLVLAFFMPHAISRNYWLQSALITLMILVLYDLAVAGQHFDARLFSERVLDVLLGCLLALIGTLLSFPPFKRASKS